MRSASAHGAAGAVAALAVLLVCMPTPGALAQARQPAVATGIRFETYSFASPEQIEFERVELLTVPLAGSVSLARNLEFRLSNGYARAALRRRDGSETVLSGLTDTEVRLTLSLARDMVRLGVVGLLPTGESELTPAQMDVAGIIAADLLPFAVSSWGTGGGMGANAAVVVPVDGSTSVGASVGYLLARKYEPLGVESFTYRPGNHVQLRAAVDHTFGSAGKGSLQVSFQQFATDELAGANLYSAGDRLQAVGSFAFATGTRGSGLVYGGYLWRERGRYSDLQRITPAQDLVYAGAALRQPLGRVVLLPLVDVRLLGNADDIDTGHAVSAGAGLEVPVGAFELVPLARARFGRVAARPGERSSFTGMDLGLTLRTRMFSR
jgi:hypothetical protein